MPGRRGAPGAAAAPTVRRLPLASLRVFVAVAERKSLTHAAEALGVTKGAVTVQIQSLEGYLGVPVFHRRGRSVELTAEGIRLLPRVQSGLRQIELALEEARSSRAEGSLRVTMLSSFLQQWFLPRVPAFHRRYADIDLRVHTSKLPERFEGSDVQVAIRMGRGNWPDLHHELLLEEWFLPVCEPRLLARHGPVETARDLEHRPLLHAADEPWSAWCDEALPPSEGVWPEQGDTFDDSVAVIHAAEGGLGYALVRWSLVQESLRSGRLALASPRVVKSQRSYWFVCPVGYLVVRKVQALREWLHEECAAMPRPPGVPKTAA
jgi:LysR family transcriptional regulator, glycine cleavage system transcriptional activator